MKKYCKSCPTAIDLRREVARLRAWLRYVDGRAGLISWSISSSDVSNDVRDALSGKPVPRKVRP